MQTNIYFNKVWENIIALTNVVPKTDSVPSQIYQLLSEINPVKVEETLLWLADATIGRDNIYFHHCDDPAQVAGFLNLLAKEIRTHYPKKTEVTDEDLWVDIFAGLGFGYLVSKSSKFFDVVSKKPNSIFQLMAA